MTGCNAACQNGFECSLPTAEVVRFKSASESLKTAPIAAVVSMYKRALMCFLAVFTHFSPAPGSNWIWRALCLKRITPRPFLGMGRRNKPAV